MWFGLEQWESEKGVVAAVKTLLTCTVYSTTGRYRRQSHGFGAVRIRRVFPLNLRVMRTQVTTTTEWVARLLSVFQL